MNDDPTFHVTSHTPVGCGTLSSLRRWAFLSRCSRHDFDDLLSTTTLTYSFTRSVDTSNRLVSDHLTPQICHYAQDNSPLSEARAPCAYYQIRPNRAACPSLSTLTAPYELRPCHPSFSLVDGLYALKVQRNGCCHSTHRGNQAPLTCGSDGPPPLLIGFACCHAYCIKARLRPRLLHNDLSDVVSICLWAFALHAPAPCSVPYSMRCYHL